MLLVNVTSDAVVREAVRQVFVVARTVPPARVPVRPWRVLRGVRANAAFDAGCAAGIRKPLSSLSLQGLDIVRQHVFQSETRAFLPF